MDPACLKGELLLALMFTVLCSVQALVQQHEGDNRWGQHAQAMMHGSMWKNPGNGGHDDKVPCKLILHF